MTMPATTNLRPVRPPMRHGDRPQIPRISHVAFLRELTMHDGRKITVDKRCIAFLCEGKPADFGGQPAVIVGFKTLAKAVPVREAYDDVKAWWRFDPSANRGPR